MEKKFIIHFKNGMTKEISQEIFNRLFDMPDGTKWYYRREYGLIHLSEIVYIDEKIEAIPTDEDALNVVIKQINDFGFTIDELSELPT